jgi:hypothetical protein
MKSVAGNAAYNWIANKPMDQRRLSIDQSAEYACVLVAMKTITTM